MKALNRETTIAKRLPSALRPPSIAASAGSRGSSIFIFSFVVLSVTRRLGGEFALLALEFRRPLLQKRRRPFLLILGRAADAKQSSLQIEPGAERHLHPLVHCPNSVVPRQRSIRDVKSRKRLRPRNQHRRR